jgi:hypothetical protein
MKRQSGIYIVPTDRWYIERTVWLIAGFVLLASTALAVFVNPIWIVFVLATGLASIVVSLTGFCIIGSALKLLGFKGLLETPGKKLYFMRTDRWYLERRIYTTVGVNISIGSALVLVHSIWWAAFTGFVGVAMVWFAATGFCILANALYWMGCEPRLAPQGKPVTRPSGTLSPLRG